MNIVIVLNTLVTLSVVFITYQFVMFIIYSRQLEKFHRERLDEKTIKSLKSWRSFFRFRLPFPTYKNKIENKLMKAGRPYNISPDEIILIQIILAIFLSVVIHILMSNWILTFLFFIFGLLLPELWLTDRIKSRNKKIISELPDFMELLTLSVESGLDFTTAIDRILDRASMSPLKEEFKHVLLEIKLGSTRRSAMRKLASRINIPEITYFTSAMILADQFGAALGPTVRIQAEQLRMIRAMNAEKRAAQAPVKIIFPLVLLIFPAVMLILFSPLYFSLKGFLF